ncbi:thiosulfate transporter TsuA-like [Saccostrea echinata]|uniref:thiosulfate transporter TsuA-like n=1 Tax=Saccostrea echinata TaxID=191078 RepID=UPI002A841B5D|nr:thiosulfate transporter TsuA-like [Saccostrea echinata]
MPSKVSVSSVSYDEPSTCTGNTDVSNTPSCPSFKVQVPPEADRENMQISDGRTPNKSACSKCGILMLKIATGLLSGVLLGIALEKSRVFDPKSVRNQMVFESFTMLKMFLSAVAAGQIVLSIISVIPKTKQYFERASEQFVACFVQKGILSTVLGSFIFGVGMSLCGACPAMVFAQIGSVVPNAVFSLIGGLFGALTYGLIAPYIEKTTKPKKPLAVHQVYKKFNLPYVVLALPMAVFLAGGVAVLEWLWPMSKDLDNLNIEISSDKNFMQQIAWPPYAAGVLVGLCQIPVVLVLCDTLGGSSCYATIVSQWVITERLQKLFPYLARCRGGMGNWWQVFLVIGVTGGAVLSAGLSSSIGSIEGVSVPDAVIGGVLMLWGSRFASGCTSGHGISGMGLFAWLSLLAVPSIFAGGISTAFLMKLTGVKDNFVTYTGAV